MILNPYSFYQKTIITTIYSFCFRSSISLNLLNTNSKKDQIILNMAQDKLIYDICFLFEFYLLINRYQTPNQNLSF